MKITKETPVIALVGNHQGRNKRVVETTAGEVIDWAAQDLKWSSTELEDYAKQKIRWVEEDGGRWEREPTYAELLEAAIARLRDDDRICEVWTDRAEALDALYACGVSQHLIEDGLALSREERDLYWPDKDLDA